MSELNQSAYSLNIVLSLLGCFSIPPEFSRTKPGPKLLFVSGGLSARQRGNPKRKKL